MFVHLVGDVISHTVDTFMSMHHGTKLIVVFNFIYSPMSQIKVCIDFFSALCHSTVDSDREENGGRKTGMKITKSDGRCIIQLFLLLNYQSEQHGSTRT